MALKGITVNTPAEQEGHIYSQDDAAIYQSIFGSDGVFNIGSKFKTTILNNNSVRVADGVLCVGGHVARTVHADYQDMIIQNGASGYKRNDIIYAKFITSGNSDTLTLEVKKGTAVTGTAADPALTQGNLYQGAALREYPLWRVKLDGLGITAVEQMFRVIPTIPELEGEIGQLNTDLAAKANSSHTHDDRYYTETEINSKLTPVTKTITWGNSSFIHSGSNTFVQNGNVGTLTITLLGNGIVSEWQYIAKLPVTLFQTVYVGNALDNNINIEVTADGKIYARNRSRSDGMYCGTVTFLCK